MENLRQRTQKEKEQASQFAIQKFVKDLVDTVDILGLALKATPEAKCNDKENHKELADLFSGVSMTQIELLKTLKRHGVEQINPIDQEFDPNQHQALYQAPIPGKEANSVFAVEKIGYTLNGRVIRPAQVGVVQSTN
jgi:molecular chaperone GrpE